MMQISSKKKFFSVLALLLAVFIALAGIWFNATFPTLSSGEPFTDAAAEKGVTLTGWKQLSEQEWEFILNADSSDRPLTLCFSGTSSGRPVGLDAVDGSGEIFRLEPTGQPHPGELCPGATMLADDSRACFRRDGIPEPASAHDPDRFRHDGSGRTCAFLL
mgnify:CR=1 FL=1